MMDAGEWMAMGILGGLAAVGLVFLLERAAFFWQGPEKKRRRYLVVPLTEGDDLEQQLRFILFCARLNGEEAVAVLPPEGLSPASREICALFCRQEGGPAVIKSRELGRFLTKEEPGGSCGFR